MLVKTMVVMATLVHLLCEDGVAVATGVGSTVTVAVMFEPVQVPAVGVIVKVTVIGEVVVFTKVPLILPDPLLAIPVTVPVLLRVQAKVVPPVPLVKAIVVMAVPEHLVCEEGVAVALGVGLTVIVLVAVAVEQLPVVTVR